MPGKGRLAQTISLLFSFSGTIGRRPYVTIALAGVLVKHVLDLAVASFAFHRDWTPLNYLVPLGVPVRLDAASPADRVFLVAMLALAVPFAWVGLAITVKRFRAIGWPAWSVAAFFIPIVNVVSFLLAAAWRDAREPTPAGTPNWLRRIVPSDPWAAAAMSLLVTGALGCAFAVLGANVFSTYGWGIFAGIPFAQGALAAMLCAVHRERTLWESICVAVFSIALTGAALFAAAFEGAVCLAMAAPIVLFFAVLGGAFGHLASRRFGGGTGAAALTMALLAPGVMGVEAALAPEAPLYEVRTSVVVNAPPQAVWKHVIAFPDLPAPRELPFRLGIAYPVRAHIDGSGRGAIRYCEFSTGSFVEPVTMWKPGRRLAFDVTHNPEPMRELSPYGAIDTPHLRGYMQSQRGEFALTPLAGGRTLLTGTTWYRHHLWPAAYWAVWSDAVIHAIHGRVLAHVKALSEAPPRGGG